MFWKDGVFIELAQSKRNSVRLGLKPYQDGHPFFPFQTLKTPHIQLGNIRWFERFFLVLLVFLATVDFLSLCVR